MSEDSERTSRRTGLFALSTVGLVFIPLFSLVFSFVSDMFQTDREITVGRLTEDRQRVAEFVTMVSERRAAAANLHFSLQRNLDADEIRERKAVHEKLYIDSQDAIYRAQNLARIAFEPGKVDQGVVEETAALKCAAPTETEPSPTPRAIAAKCVDDSYNALIAALGYQETSLTNLQACRRIAMIQAEPRNRRVFDEAVLKRHGCALFAEKPADMDARFNAASRAVQLCMNQFSVEFYKRRSARQGLFAGWLAARLPHKDRELARALVNLRTYCNAPPAFDAAQELWTTYQEQVRALQAGFLDPKLAKKP
jgi:hypothetical protein